MKIKYLVVIAVAFGLMLATSIFVTYELVTRRIDNAKINNSDTGNDDNIHNNDDNYSENDNEIINGPITPYEAQENAVNLLKSQMNDDLIKAYKISPRISSSDSDQIIIVIRLESNFVCVTTQLFPHYDYFLHIPFFGFTYDDNGPGNNRQYFFSVGGGLNVIYDRPTGQILNSDKINIPGIIDSMNDILNYCVKEGEVVYD
jgi:hypothetical protein